MPSSIRVRCEQCGYENAVRHHICGMCGAKLPTPPQPSDAVEFSNHQWLEEPVQQRSEPRDQVSNERVLLSGAKLPPPPQPSDAVEFSNHQWLEEPVQQMSEPRDQVSKERVLQVGGPSFLGLSDDSSSHISYRSQDDLKKRHWGRSLVLFVVLIGVGVAGWRWRDQLRTYVAARLPQQPKGKQTEPVSLTERPSSEVGAKISSGRTVNDKPLTLRGGLPLITGQTPSPNQSAPTATAASSNTSPARERPAESTNSKQEPRTTALAIHDKYQTKHSAPAASDVRELEAQGEKYLYGMGTPASCSGAQTSLQAAAERGNAKAESVLGTMYATGHCVSHDFPVAYRWFAKALEHDPNNDRLERDQQVLWNQMSPDEHQIATRP